MPKPSRALWLPAIAVLLPCAFIGVVGYKWLTLEREASANRDVAAAETAVREMRRELSAALTAASEGIVLGVAGRTDTAPPFMAPAPPSSLILDWFVFTAPGALVAPDPDAAILTSVTEYHTGVATPAWAQARERVEPSGAGDPRAPSQPAVDALLAASTTPAVTAAAHLAIARAFAGADQADRADYHARAIIACCPSARDGNGISMPLYGARLRAGLYAQQGNGPAKLAALAGELHALATSGYLGHADDLVTLSLVADRSGDPRLFDDVVAEVDRTRSRFAALGTTATSVARWVASAADPAGDVEFRPTQSGTGRAIAARLRAPGGRQLVLMLAETRLAEWTSTWFREHSAFDGTLVPGDSPATGNELAGARQAFRLPLSVTAPVATLVLTLRSSDSGSDQGRETLFVVALTAAVLLALALGLFAMRDVSRELRTASLRATFVASVTHELKTPLSSIRLIAETLRQKRARPEVHDELLDTIVDETDRLTRLVDNVLSSSRIESGTRRYSSVVVPFGSVVRDAIARFNPVLQRGGFQILATIDDPDIAVLADPDALSESVINLLGNAAKYSGTSREIRVSAGRRHDSAEVSVADDGIGIPTAEQARVFDSFYRAPNAAADTAGAGLGLALVRHFAEAHGGRVSVASTPGRGSVFTLSLPIQS